MHLQVCMDSYPFCRLVKREWLQHVEESGVTSTKGYEWTLTITRFVNPTVPISNRSSNPCPCPKPRPNHDPNPKLTRVLALSLDLIMTLILSL